MTDHRRPLGVYIHWPYCLSKCPYCDFNSHIKQTLTPDQWVNGIIHNLRFFAAQTSDSHYIKTVFFGGGTPSLMPASCAETILTFMRDHWVWGGANDKSVEVTLEANPNSAEQARFEGFRAAGINRLSICVQSFYDDDLKALGREHKADEARQAITHARSVFDRFSFDLIYARSNQTIDAWQTELKQALDFGGSGHISLYQLTIEKGTAFQALYDQGKLIMPSQEKAAAFYEATGATTQSYGFLPYEVSNYAKAGQACDHNLIYWRYQDYIGVGPGAHGRYKPHGGLVKQAAYVHKAPEKWHAHSVPDASEGGFLKTSTPLNQTDMAMEAMMMGARLSEGVPFYHVDTGLDLSVYMDKNNYDQLCDDGFLTRDAQRLLLTDRGRLCLNGVMGYLVNNQ
jgi:putative oxygen-independent coproporphyrinogen III oxidase